MNYLLSILFLIIISVYYQLTGRKVLKLFHYDLSFDLSFLAGFLSVAFIGFLVGVPCQYFHLSWKIYLIILSIALLANGAFCFDKEMFKSINRQTIFEFIREHYFIFLLSILFVVFAACNLLPYYRMNYDDCFYLGKIINQVGSTALSNENYFSGEIISSSHDLTRILNTYEILYGYFATIFHISIPFFCRFTMAFHNYLLTFVVYKMFAEIFISKKFSQYSVAFFALFIIAAGVWYNDSIAIFRMKMYDQWQISTAIWYGGSVVRMIAIPAIILLGKELWEKITSYKLIMLVIAYIGFVSYSTIFIHYGIVIFYLFLVTKCIAFMFSENKYRFIGLVCLIGLVCGLYYFNKQLPSLPVLGNYVDSSQVEQLEKYYRVWYDGDFAYTYGIAILPLSLILASDLKQRYCLIPIVGLYILEYNHQFANFMIFSSFNYCFVVLRLFSSMQILVLFMISLMLVKLIEKVLAYPVFGFIAAFCFVGWMCYFFKDNYSIITSYNYGGAGVCAFGYSTYPLKSNDELVPDLLVELGDYFDSLPYGNYQVLAPKAITLDGDKQLTYNSLIVASNRIEIYNAEHKTGFNHMSEDEFTAIQGYFSGGTSLATFESYIEKYSIDYVLVQSQSIEEQLVSQGYELVLQDDHQTYYLLKTGLQ